MICASNKSNWREQQYAFDDFTISQVAKGLGKLWDGELYANRSKGFELVWNPNTTIQDDDFLDIEGIQGFFQVCSCFIFFVLSKLLTPECSHVQQTELSERLIRVIAPSMTRLTVRVTWTGEILVGSTKEAQLLYVHVYI